MGIKPAQLENMFQPFAQGDNSTTRRFGGTGLGLSICKRLAQMLGGDIQVQSRPRCGSRFIVTISVGDLKGVAMIVNPHEAIGQPDASDARTSDPTSRGAKLRGRVLLAEDGIHNQRVICYFLEEAGLEVAVADNGHVACERALQAKAAAAPFNVILMDMQMPELDGYGATALLRNEGYTEPIIAVTANAMTGDREKCLAAGCNEHLTKPVDRRQLLALLGRYLSVRQDDHPAAATAVTAPPSELPTAVAFNDGPIQLEPIQTACVKFLPAFLADIPKQTENLISAMREADIAKLQKLLHDLKGTAGLFGLRQVSELAARSEKQLKASAAIDSTAADIETIAQMLHRAAQIDPARFPVSGDASASSKSPSQT